LFNLHHLLRQVQVHLLLFLLLNHPRRLRSQSLRLLKLSQRKNFHLSLSNQRRQVVINLLIPSPKVL